MPPRRRALSGQNRVLDWCALTSDPDRRDALLLWARLVCEDPDSVTTGYMASSTRPGREIRYADVPGAATRVTFALHDTPAYCVHILIIDDVSYRMD